MLLEDDDGGQVFIRGQLCFVWYAGDDASRRLAAVQLVQIDAASLTEVADAFGVSTVTLSRWRKVLDTSGVAGLATDKGGPRGPSRLTEAMVDDIRARRSGGATFQAIADAVGVSASTVRRALPPAARTRGPQPRPKAQPRAGAVDLPVLPPATDPWRKDFADGGDPDLFTDLS